MQLSPRHLALGPLFLLACATTPDEIEDGPDDTLGGKADGIVAGTREAFGVLRVANELSLAELRTEVGLSKRAATNITTYRAGLDGDLGTDDDVTIFDLDELDGISYVGPAAFSKLLTYAEAQGWTEPPNLVVEYRYGNQLASSMLAIYDDGTSEYRERLTPTDIHDGIEYLPASLIAELKQQVTEAASGMLAVTDLGPSTPTSSSGKIMGYQADGSQVVLELVDYDHAGTGRDQLTINTSMAATRLRITMLDLVETDMPR